jgi:hypothetical protein
MVRKTPAIVYTEHLYMPLKAVKGGLQFSIIY